MPMDDPRASLITLSGTVEHIVYTNEENGYTVCDLSDEDGKDGGEEYFTAVGILPFLGVGDRIRALGK